MRSAGCWDVVKRWRSEEVTTCLRSSGGSAKFLSSNECCGVNTDDGL